MNRDRQRGFADIVLLWFALLAFSACMAIGYAFEVKIDKAETPLEIPCHEPEQKCLSAASSSPLETKP